MFERASEQAAAVDHLFLVLLAIAALVILATLALLVVFPVRYRHGRTAGRRLDRRRGRALEYTWLGIPLLLFVFVFFSGGASLYLKQPDDTPDTLLIHALAKQWMWHFEHPGGQREINALHLPVGRPVRILLASQDVIHSFYVPALRLKQDVVPGYLTDARFTLDRDGEFHLFCAEYCGTDHAGMRGRLVAMPAVDYDEWLAGRDAGTARVVRGGRLYREHGCGQCHDPGEGMAGPALTGLYGAEVVLADGGRVTVDENYLREAMLDPDRQVRAGFEPVMPAYAGRLSEAEVMSLIAYLKARQGETPP